MPCCNCETCACPSECFPKDHESLDKWHKEFDCLRQQWSDYQVRGPCPNTGGAGRPRQCCCQKPSSDQNLVKGRFGLAWVTETPQKTVCTPCGWQLEICDTPSQVEYQCQKMEQWASCPPIDEYGCSPKPVQKCCVAQKCCAGKPLCHRAPSCAVKVMPFQATSEQDCWGCKCKSGTNDKGVATDDCNCNESKDNDKDKKDDKKDNDKPANTAGAPDPNLKDIVKPNDGKAAQNPPDDASVATAAANNPRNARRGRLGRR